MDLKRLVSMRCSLCCQQSFFGDGCSSGIACPDKHIWHAFFVSPSPPDRWRGVVSSATISTPLTHSEWAVCVIFILSSIFYKGQQGAPIIFPVQSQCKVRAMSKLVLPLPSRSLTWRRKVGMKRLCGKGAFLLSQKFFRKRCSFLCTFSKPVKGENFLRYPLSSKPNDFMPLIARKNQGSTPMPLLK